MRTSMLAAGAFAAAVTVASPTVPVAQPAEPARADQLVLPPHKAGRTRPLVVVVAENHGAEITDFVIPLGVLRESGVADVRSLSTDTGPVLLRRGLRVVADQTLAGFDAAEPTGADIVIIPAQAMPKDARLVGWIRAQAAKGATVISVCEGARVLADAGLLKDKHAVTHWSAMAGLAKAYPDTAWVRDRRYVQDGRVISTAGVTASIPMSLALVEAIGGRAAAVRTGKTFGVNDWNADHRTADFALRPGEFSTAVGTLAAVWTHETVAEPIADGVDEVALALRTDAWGRSFQTTVVTTHQGRTPIRSRHGLVILPDEEPGSGRYVIPAVEGPAVPQLEAAMGQIGRRYGPFAVRMATLDMEYDASSARQGMPTTKRADAAARAPK